MGDPAVTPIALIVNWNAGRHLAACVASLLDEGVDDIVIADNGSTDGSLEAIASEYPAVEAFATGHNLGLGGGTNRAADRARARRRIGRPLLAVNPDVVIQPGAVKAMMETLASSDRLGIVGPRIENTDGSLYPSARTFPNLTDSVGHAFLGLIWPSNPYTRRYRMLDWDHDAGGGVDWVSGACLLIDDRLWDALDGFDESYFMYAEDVDLCWRARRAGWEVAYEPAATVTHVQGSSTRQRPYRMIAAHHRSLLRFARKSTTGPQRALLPLMALGLALRTALAWVHHRVAARH